MANRKYNSNQDFGGLTSVKSSDQKINCFESSNKQHVLTALGFPSSDSKVLDDPSIVSNHSQDKTIINEFKIKRSKDSELNGSRITRQQLLNTRINVKKTTKNSSRASRESIRRKLADQEPNRGDENSLERTDSKNLLICFMNETVSSDEEGHLNQSEERFESNYNNCDFVEEEVNHTKDSILESLSTSSLTNNISRHKGHVIIPLSKNPIPNVPNSIETLETRIQPISADLNTSSSSLNEEEEEEPISTRHQKWSFTAAAMKNRERSCEEWNESSSEDEDDFDEFIQNRKELHLTKNLNESNSAENEKNFCSQEFVDDHWQPFPFVSETQKSSDLFYSPGADLNKGQLGSNLLFFQQLALIQAEARKKLKEAKQFAVHEVEKDRKTRREINSRDISNLLRSNTKNNDCPNLPNNYRRLNRHLLTEMNVGQLQVILNYLLSQAKTLNEDLVDYLLTRDELAIEQDSLLTDVEDITICISATSPTDTPSPCAL